MKTMRGCAMFLLVLGAVLAAPSAQAGGVIVDLRPKTGPGIDNPNPGGGSLAGMTQAEQELYLAIAFSDVRPRRRCCARLL